MFEVMLIGLLVLVLILIPLCIGFVVIVRWIMRRTRRVSGQTPVTAAEPLPPPGAAEKGVVRTESLRSAGIFNALRIRSHSKCLESWGLLQKRPENLSCPWRMLWRRRTIRTRPCCRIN